MIVDFRSDTVTRPTAAMKTAMIEAPLGDDVLGDDATVIALEQRCAELSGKEACLFMPSGTMANLVGISVSTRAGDEVLMHEGAHPFNYEAAGPSRFAGVQIRPLSGDHGILDVATVAAAIRPEDDHFAPATLLCLEDTANRGGGSIYPLERLDALTELAHDRGLKVHMDGARIFNAVVASGISLKRRLQGCDTAAFCFSKALGAPVGSVLVGTAADMKRGRRIRKSLGGGMRQSGMLAAAAIYALDHHIDRLSIDHENASRLVTGLQALGLQSRTPPTNMVYVDVPDGPRWEKALAEAGVRCFAVGPTTLRLVLHLDVDQAGVDFALKAFSTLAQNSP